MKYQIQDIGIPSENLPFIFDRFFQSDNSLTREYEGTGIGLSLTKELVVLMNGDLRLKASLGLGSKFTVIIPIKEISLQRDDFQLTNFMPQSILNRRKLLNLLKNMKKNEKTDKSIILNR